MIENTDVSLDHLAPVACAEARELIEAAERLRTRRERAKRRQFARLFQDRRALEITISLTDETMRITSVRSAANVLRASARRASISGFGVVNAAGLRTISLLARWLPSVALGLVHREVRRQSKDLILAAESATLRQHITERSNEGISLNVNVLGEAVLGEGEARARLAQVLEMMGRDEVNYVSVKLSSVVGQMVTLDHEGSLVRASQVLRTLYRAAQRDGVFVNLDMEEFRDLRLTLDAFEGVLSESEFVATSAGLVLQAYLPESHAALERLILWAQQRFEVSGGQIKVRLVKGANLAMEQAEAELHGWTYAPYGSKAEVDASYARLLDRGLRREHARALRIGVASHNLFHLAWALNIARQRGVLDQLDVEMLEGMANAEALAIVQRGRPVLLYAPVTHHDDFAAAVAYLVRRLDENTSDENYLKAAFYISRDEHVFLEQQQRFLHSVHDRHRVSTRSRRHDVAPRDEHLGFVNSLDGDPTSPDYVRSVTDALASVRHRPLTQIPLGVAHTLVATDQGEDGRDPNDRGAVWYRYDVAERDQIDATIASALAGANHWANVDVGQRRAVLSQVADVMQRQRATTIAVMSRDAGKTVTEADPEVSEAIDFVRFYATLAHDAGESTPLGVVVVVPPWNFPYAIPAGGICAALAAGNAVIIKPAPEAVAVAWELVQQLWQGGVPRDVLQFLPTRDDQWGRYLVTHESVDAVILTGSFETAELFTSWKPEINLLAETSGKNAIIVSSYADIDLAVKDLVQSAFGHAGQKCSAASLAIVDQSVHDNPAFFRQLSDSVQSLCVGPGYDVASVVGPVIRPPEAALARALQELDDGESWLVRPECLDGVGYLWRPGVKIGVRPGSWSHRHEWFGPVLAVMRAPDFERALQWQNDVPFGLTAGLQSLDEGECQFWIDHVEAGNLYLNRGITGAVVNRQPFGGWKRSSVGPTAKAGGTHYVNLLRNWSPLLDLEGAKQELTTWWEESGSRSLDHAGLRIEANIQRYRYTLAPIVVRVDEKVAEIEVQFLSALVATTGTQIEWSAPGAVSGLANLRVESVDELVARSREFAKVRWLSHEDVPTVALLGKGLSVDRRPLAQCGAVEGPRWFNEQSVAMTRHRYGNTNAGPKPECRGLASLAGRGEPTG